jgi:hypothetical protein
LQKDAKKVQDPAVQNKNKNLRKLILFKMTEPTLQKYFQDDPPSLFDQINGKVVKI